MSIDIALLLAVLATGSLWIARRRGKFSDRLNSREGIGKWLAYGARAFPVLLVAFIVVSFVIMPFRVTGESMNPALANGDYIAVLRFKPDIRIPLVGLKVFNVTSLRRGDVIVLRSPRDGASYVKRVIGLPGDKVGYAAKRLTINDQSIPTEHLDDYVNDRLFLVYPRYKETFGAQQHEILVEAVEDGSAGVHITADFREHCEGDQAHFTCNVPENAYFVMGDNRDNSTDSRTFGVVPDQNVIGVASFM